MSATLLVNELSALISESKRKNNELRTAAEKSLQELKSLPTTSEQQISADLSKRPAFIEPFLIACGTRNAKFASSGVTCLQRLVVSKGLPKTRLNETLDAFNACSELGLDLQLKVLQALPSLVQNYAEELSSDLLAGALQVCASLESSNVQTVSGVAAATLQQLVTAVFEKVVAEDSQGDKVRANKEISVDGESISLRPAALDACRLFRDLVLAAEERHTSFVQMGSLSPSSSLDLVWSSLNAHPRLFAGHAELSLLIRANLIPLVTRTLTNKLPFVITVRSLRVIDLLLSRYLSKFQDECKVALRCMAQILDTDSVPAWKRVCVMEVVRNVFTVGNFVIDAYIAYDMAEADEPVIQNLMSAFVRLSTEKPASIGLGQQSTAPINTSASRLDRNSENAVLEAAGGMAGVISSALGSVDSNQYGISSEWSIPRTACLDHLDKPDAPLLPDTYIYALVLECLGILSDSLARVVLPLSVQQERSKSSTNSPASDQKGASKTTNLSRSQSFRRRAVPLNPLESEETSATKRARAVAGLIEKCWPAILATSSTFLNAALEEQYYRNLIKAYQRFAQVAGLLRLKIPRDALMTTLSKSAVPPHIRSASMMDGLKSPTLESPRVAASPKSLLSVDGLVSQAASLSVDRDRRPSFEPPKAMLSTRNLLCLRALLNLAIALGPTLGSAFDLVVDTLKQADIVLSSSSSQVTRPGNSASQKVLESPAGVQAFTAEITAVEAAASRLLESTADYPNEPFLDVLNAFCGLLNPVRPPVVGSPTRDQSPSPPSTPLKSRSFSGLAGLNTVMEMQTRDYQFVIPKLGNLAQINITRLAQNNEKESGWNVIVNTLNDIAANSSRPREARRAAADVLCKMSAGVISEALEEEESIRSVVQHRALSALHRIIDSIYSTDDELVGTDLEIQGRTIDALRSILENYGESLVAGWNDVIAILSSSFERSQSENVNDDAEKGIHWNLISNDFVSLPVGRVAFAATQLVCSDFLTALPLAVTPSLIELLGRFLQQTDDLNVALTTVTTTWNLSDFLFGKLTLGELDEFVSGVQENVDIEESITRMANSSRSAQTLMLLLRLRNVTRLTQSNIRNATFQTICSIFRSHGDELSPRAWDFTLRAINFRIASDDAALYCPKEEQGDMEESATADEQMSKTIIAGTSEVFAQHIRIIEQTTRLQSLWKTYLEFLGFYLDTEVQALYSAVYESLFTILPQLQEDSSSWATPVMETVGLWTNRIPGPFRQTSDRSSNQEPFIAYANTAGELYRLARGSLNKSLHRQMVDKLYYCIEQSDGPRYSADLNTMSPLQNKVVSLLKEMRTDVPDMPSCLISVAAKMVTLHHEKAQDRNHQGPTFVALVRESIEWLQALVLAHLDKKETLKTGAILSTVQSLRCLIADKYVIPADSKGTPLWRKATRTALELIPAILARIDSAKSDDDIRRSLWIEFISIARGIVDADHVTSVKDLERVYDDQIFDIESFKRLKEMLTPRLGEDALSDELRQQYCRALFQASMIHSIDVDRLLASELPTPDSLGASRRGRVKQIPCIQRERMCYICFSELAELSSRGDGSEERKRLETAAVPFLLLRLAIPIRGYIADQPIRGRRPQPRSEYEELMFCFDQVKKLQIDPDALPPIPVTNRWVNGTSHFGLLYPLLVKAVAAAGDKWSGSQEVLKPLQEVLDMATRHR